MGWEAHYPWRVAAINRNKHCGRESSYVIIGLRAVERTREQLEWLKL